MVNLHSFRKPPSAKKDEFSGKWIVMNPPSLSDMFSKENIRNMGNMNVKTYFLCGIRIESANIKMFCLHSDNTQTSLLVSDAVFVKYWDGNAV